MCISAMVIFKVSKRLVNRHSRLEGIDYSFTYLSKSIIGSFISVLVIRGHIML